MSKWTAAAVTRVTGKRIDTRPKSAKKRKSSGKSPNKDSRYVGVIFDFLQQQGYNPVREYRFIEKKQNRFDIALPEQKIAIEWEGGIFSHGRHTRGVGYAKDCDKYNSAVLLGWRLLRFTSLSVREGWLDNILSMIKEIEVVG